LSFLSKIHRVHSVNVIGRFKGVRASASVSPHQPKLGKRVRARLPRQKSPRTQPAQTGLQAPCGIGGSNPGDPAAKKSGIAESVSATEIGYLGCVIAM
jgi:hypothetical protein